MKKLLSLVLVALMVLSSVVTSFAITDDAAAAIPTRPTITHEDREAYNNNPEDYVIDVWFSDATIAEGETTAQISMNLKNNFGFWATRIFFVYPPCITVTKIDSLYNRKDAYDPAYSLYTKNDADSNMELGPDNYKTLTDIVNLEQPGLTYDIPGHKDVKFKDLFDVYGYKFGLLLPICENNYYTAEDDENDENFYDFANFKAVDGPMFTIDLTYDESLNTTGETEIPIFAIMSQIDNLFSYGDSGIDDGEFTTIGYDGTIYIESSEPTVTISDAEITVGDTEATFTMKIDNNPGLFGFSGFLAYDELIKVTEVTCGDVFPSLLMGGPTAEGNETTLNQSIRDWSTDDNPLYNKTFGKVFDDAGASYEDYATRLAAENDSLTVNNTQNGTFITFKVSTKDLPVGEYDITFIPEPDGILNVDGDNVEFKYVNGKLTVNSCDHNWSKTGTTAATCTENAIDNYECTKCHNTKSEEVADSALGHDYQISNTVDATCTEAEVITYACSRCTAGYTAEGKAAKGHTNETIPAVDATCTTAGATAGVKCSVCGDIVEEPEATPALGHDWVQGETSGNCGEIGTVHYTCSRCTATKTEEGQRIEHAWTAGKKVEPTCTVDGSQAYKCSNCEAEKSEAIPATGHDYYVSVSSRANCTEPGMTGYMCRNCYDGYDEIIPALGHDMSETSRTNATCTEDGLVEKSCSRCTHTEEEVLPALGHDYQNSVTAPTCTVDGYTTHTCSRCNDTYADSKTDALGHDFASVVTEPTCTAGGYTTYTCERCYYTYVDDETDALGHDYDSVVTAPTCTVDGYTTHTCSRCNDTYVDSKTNALGHEYGEPVLTEATCTEKAFLTYTCIRNDHSYTVEVGDAPLGHDFENGEEVSAEPTCTEDGYKGHKCSRCDEISVDETIPAKGHAFDEGVITKAPTVDEEGVKTFTCEVCGFKKTEAIAKLEAPAGTDDTSGNKGDGDATDGMTDSTAKPTGDTLAIVAFAASVALVALAAAVVAKKKKIFSK